MTAVVSLLIVVALSLLVVRVGAVALMMTGLSEEVAQFQALSAFSGAGFTTQEAESIVSHPARRRIASVLIRLGGIGVVTAISTLILSFVNAGQTGPWRLLVMVLGVVALIALARSHAFNRALTPLIERVLSGTGTVELHDYAALLHLSGDYRIGEMNLESESWLVERRLDELDLSSEGVLVLGVSRPEEGYIGTPPATLRFCAGDSLIVYGRAQRLQELSGRKQDDDSAHETAKAEHQRHVAAQHEKLAEREEQRTL